MLNRASYYSVFVKYSNLLKEAVKNWEILELLVKKENIKFVVENFLGI